MAQRHVDVLIIGAGIAGLLLARELRQRGSRVVLAHDPARTGASEAAVGLLNPVRGRRCTLAWRAAETFAAAREVYATIATSAGEPVMRELPVVRAFASAEERACFERRAATIAAAGFGFQELTMLPSGLRGMEHGAISLAGGGALDARALTERLRNEMRAAGVLLERRCAAGDLMINPTHVTWTPEHLEAALVVLAGGAEDIATTLAGPQPLRPVRGESLLVCAPALEPVAAFVCGHHLAPIAPELWSCGGTKVPGDAGNQPTAEGRAELEQFLSTHLGVPWEIVGHWSGVRAATLDTKPLVGRLHKDPRIVVFNGFGSQGFSVAPWLARLLANHIIDEGALPPEVDPARYAPRPDLAQAGPWQAVAVARAIALGSLAPGDLAIDLTVGNGGDTLWLAEVVGTEGAVLGIDVQPEAIEATRRRLDHAACDVPVSLRCSDHAGLEVLVAPNWRGRVGAIVANLGHLPGSSSPVSTRPESTIPAFAAALPLLRPGGVLVAVINTQHTCGSAELNAIEAWTHDVDTSRYEVVWQRSPDRSPRAPVVVAIKRRAG